MFRSMGLQPRNIVGVLSLRNFHLTNMAECSSYKAEYQDQVRDLLELTQELSWTEQSSDIFFQGYTSSLTAKLQYHCRILTLLKPDPNPHADYALNLGLDTTRDTIQ